MKNSARTGDIGDPMDVPEDCSKNLSLQDEDTQVRRRSWIWSGERLVLSPSDECCSNMSLAMVHASDVGTLVNRETTSKLIMMSLGRRVSLSMNWANWSEFLTWLGVLPTRGWRILVRCLAVL